MASFLLQTPNFAAMDPRENMYELGRALKPHGLKGEVAIKLDVDDPRHYAELDMVWVDRRGALVPYTILSISIRPKSTVVRFDGVDDLEGAQALAGSTLMLPLSALPPLDGLKFYYHEVVGFELTDVNFGALGTILQVMDLPGNPLFKTEKDGREGLFPIQDQTLVSVDREGKVITVEMPEGLPSLYFG